jgi:putative mRNA 3-end processing factor
MADKAPLIFTEQGWKINGLQTWLDPIHPVPTAIISHAHGDHAIPGHHRVYCTVDTAKILAVRFRKFAWEVIACKWNEPFIIDGISFMFHPAGHILGAAQISWTVNDERTVYTGDFNPGDNPTCNAYELVPCDTLITETTFGQIDKKHPDAVEVLKTQLPMADVNYVIGSYVLGKAQRLNRLISDHCPGLQVMVHPKIIPYHHAYMSAGFSPGTWQPFQRQQFKRNRNIVYIVPPNVISQLPVLPYTRRGFASGWLQKQEGYDLMLPISDHADWFDLLTIVEKSGTKKVYTLHGEGLQLQKYFDSKIPVIPLEQ